MNLEDLARDMAATQLLYLDDSYLKESSCSILKVESDDRKSAYVVLDRSIFHPKSGGQPSDQGRISTDTAVFEVRKVMATKGVLIHWGKYVQGTLPIGSAQLKVDWDLRQKCMRRHTAAHLFDHCLATVLGKRVETTDSWVGDESYIGYRGEIPTTGHLQEAEKMENELILKGAKVTSQLMTREQVVAYASDAPNLARLPTGATLRVVTIEGCGGIPCGGTHVRNIREIGQFKLGAAQSLDGSFRTYFGLIL